MVSVVCDDGKNVMVFKIKLPLYLLSLTLNRKIMAFVMSLLEEYCLKALWAYIS